MTFNEQIAEVVKLLQEARRPIFIWGAGIRPYAEQARSLARSLGIPVACTWGAIDLMHHDDPLMAGGFGTHGTRAANFAVQNADLIISIGSRLDTKATGQPSHWARGARVVMVDLDPREIEKFSKLGKTIDVGICADAGEFIEALAAANVSRPQKDTIEWNSTVRHWRQRYDTPKVPWPGINPYELVKEIGKWTTSNDILVSDTGTALGYLMQAFPFKGERFLHAFNMTPMGYGLPAGIGAAFATAKRAVLVTGDGSIMMALPELATVSRWQLNIKIILLNNGGHAMCRQTERQWFGGRHASTDVESGLGFPNFEDTARAFYLPVRSDMFSSRMPEDTYKSDLRMLFTYRETSPAFMQIPIHPDAHLIPQARFGAPIEDQEPMLDREEFRANMIVPTL